MTRIVLHIDRLVLHGVDHADAAAVTQALRVELGMQLAKHDCVARLSAASLPCARPIRVEVPRGGDGSELGRAIAAGIGSWRPS